MKKKIILTSVVTISLCLSLIAGSTYALFTSEKNIGVEVTAGKVNITAVLGNLKTYAFGSETWANKPAGTATQQHFELGGMAELTNDNTKLVLTKMVPGDKAEAVIDVTNNSNVVVKYKIMAFVEDLNGGTLSNGLRIVAKTNDGTTSKDYRLVPLKNTAGDYVEFVMQDWITVGLDSNGNGLAIDDITVTVEFPNSTNHAAQNEFQTDSVNLNLHLIAVQGNGDAMYDNNTVAP